jgi:glycosyltransferase involved in cell wall biosynthesis
MTDSRQHGDPDKVSWLDSSVYYVRHGLTILRRDGPRYLIARTYQLLSQQVGTFMQSVHIRREPLFGDRTLKIDDLQPAVCKSQGDYPPPAQSQSIPVDSTQTSNSHSKLVQLGCRCHNDHIREREALIHEGQLKFSGRRVLFVSPIRVLGGGANLIFLAARVMRQMGLDAQILNINVHRGWFESHYPQLDIPVTFADIDDIPRMAADFDAVVATSNPTVAWIASLSRQGKVARLGYYIQDYEPYFYPKGSRDYQRAADSYTMIPSIVRLVTTPWIADQIQLHHHLESSVIGAHMDADLFQPCPRKDASWPERPLRVTAMIRPSTPRRNPKLTMAVLQRASQKFSTQVEFRLFGCDVSEPGFSSLEVNFPWKLAGQLRSTQVASLYNEADIFVDFSEFQAFGLTALEAMAMGLAVIVPSTGGTGVYGEPGANCLVVDGRSEQACLEALSRLIEDASLRQKLQSNAISTAARFYPELPTLNMLKELFPDP